MPYIYLTKKEARIFGSIASLCASTGLKPDNLYTNFGRLKKKEFETDEYRIIKAEIEKSKSKIVLPKSAKRQRITNHFPDVSKKP